MNGAQLKTFDGDPRKWHEINDHSQTLISNSKLESVGKLNYLLTSLTGANREIEGHALTKDHYSIVWDLLVRRFGDTDILRRRLYTELCIIFGVR